MSDIVYSELTERYWIMVNGQRDREITQYMDEHDKKARKSALNEVIDHIKLCEEEAFENGAAPIGSALMATRIWVEQLKEQKNE